MLTYELAMQPSDRLQIEVLHFNGFYHCRCPNELLLYDLSRKKTRSYIARKATLQRRAPRDLEGSWSSGWPQERNLLLVVESHHVKFLECCHRLCICGAGTID